MRKISKRVWVTSSRWPKGDTLLKPRHSNPFCLGLSLSLPMRSELLVALFKHSFFMPPCVVILRESVLRFSAMIVNVSVLLVFLSVVALYVLAVRLITSKLVYVTCSWWTVFLIPWDVVRQPLVAEGLAFPILVKRHGGAGPSHKWCTPEGMMNLLSWDTTVCMVPVILPWHPPALSPSFLSKSQTQPVENQILPPLYIYTQWPFPLSAMYSSPWVNSYISSKPWLKEPASWSTYCPPQGGLCATVPSLGLGMLHYCICYIGLQLHFPDLLPAILNFWACCVTYFSSQRLAHNWCFLYQCLQKGSRSTITCDDLFWMD